VLVGVDTLHPSIEQLVDVVKVVLALAALAPTSASGGFFCEFTIPSVVATGGKDEIAISSLDTAGEITSASANVEFGVAARLIAASFALVSGDLHQTLLSAITDSPRSARTLLHGDGCKHDSWDTGLPSEPIEEVDVFAAVLEWAVGHGESLVKGLVDNIAHVDVGRVPSSTINTAVQVVDVSVRPRISAWLRLSVGSSTSSTTRSGSFASTASATPIVGVFRFGFGLGLFGLLGCLRGWGGGRIAGPAAPTSRLLEGSILLATDEGGVMMAGGESSTAMADAGMGGDRRQAKGDQNGWELH